MKDYMTCYKSKHKNSSKRNNIDYLFGEQSHKINHKYISDNKYFGQFESMWELLFCVKHRVGQRRQVK